MNLLYIHTHDSGRFIQPYGYNIPAPALMTLARQGTTFRNAYCAAPTCSPSRACLLTGTNAHTAGMTGLAHRGFALARPERHLAHFLQANGFATALCGVQHETHGDPALLGYDTVHVSHPYYPMDFDSIDAWNTQQAISYLKAPHEQPFFLSLGFVNTHKDFPSAAKPRTNPDEVAVPPLLPDTAETHMDFAAYIDSVKTVDDCVGQVLDALDETGLRNDTIVLFTTDHGIAFPHYKCTLRDGGIGVAMLLSAPSLPDVPRTVDALVSQLDIYPTLCDLLGLTKPDWLEGYSLLPILQGKANSVRDFITAEINYHAAYEPARCLRTERYKLIRYYDDYPGKVLCNVDDGPSKTLLLENGWQHFAQPKDMLFDLLHDPAEGHNLVGDAIYEQVYTQLDAQLADWMRRTEDPLLHGTVPTPENATLHARTCVSTALEAPIKKQISKI